MKDIEKDEAHSQNCLQLLEQCEMFQRLTPDLLKSLSEIFTYRQLNRNETLLRQGAPSDRFYLLESGEVRRKFVDPEDGKVHNVEFAIKAKSINSMRVLSGEPVHATVKCVSEECKVFELRRDALLKAMKAKPEIATKIAEGLCEVIRTGSRKYATPLLQQQQQEVNIPAVSIAAGIESYYRSALNAKLNARLTGVKAELFPNMHIQVPSRITYITGFKGLRSYLDHHIDPDVYESPTIVRLGCTLLPGIVMTPVASLLEASNAGHMNAESMTVRWMRGIVPRCAREIVFGIGLNQLSDYFEERVHPYMNGHLVLSNAVGSLIAGVVSGYLSHVPHNLSTYKLLQPEQSYHELYRLFVKKSVPPLVKKVTKRWESETARQMTRAIFATCFPRGVLIRTTQIVGSFIILNGTINYLQLREHHKILKAVGAH